MTTHVHLVGSIPLQCNTEVFQEVAQRIGTYVTRYPDGETGDRSRWVQWLDRIICDDAQFVRAPTREVTHATGATYHHYAVRPGLDPAQLKFSSLGYADAALASYEDFLRLRSGGTLPSNARFLVAMPTAIAFLWCFITPSQRHAVEPAYNAALLRELAEIVNGIPHDDLAIQWDTVHELLIIEGVRKYELDNPKDDLISRLVHTGNQVPDDVELGYHFCYGDSGHKHSIEPKDMGLMVEFANGLVRGLDRPLDFIHMPVPRDRNDVSYFQPLVNFEKPVDTELYLGLIHLTDGIEGTKSRIAAARKVIRDFGVATECGFGRRPPETILQLLDLHNKVAQSMEGCQC